MVRSIWRQLSSVTDVVLIGRLMLFDGSLTCTTCLQVNRCRFQFPHPEVHVTSTAIVVIQYVHRQFCISTLTQAMSIFIVWLSTGRCVINLWYLILFSDFNQCCASPFDTKSARHQTSKSED